MIVKLLNSKYLLKVLHRRKILWCCICSTLALVILAYCYESSHYTLAFILTLVASLMGGFSQALGEMTMIGLTKGINPFCVSGFSSGTGLSGVFAIGAGRVMDFLKNQLGSWVSLSYIQRSNDT